MKLKNTLLLITVALFAIFSTQNTGSIQINFFFWDFKISLILFIYIIFILGMLLSYFLFSVKKYFGNKEASSPVKKVKKKREKKKKESIPSNDSEKNLKW